VAQPAITNTEMAAQITWYFMGDLALYFSKMVGYV
jgi:hypothetical protein